jgi:hypothetical protein
MESLSYVIAAAVGSCAFFIVYGSYMLIRRGILKKSGGRAMATVVAVNIGKDDEGAVTYRSVFEYFAEGNNYVTVNPTAYYLPRHKVGDKAAILYDRNNPERISVQNEKTGLIQAVILIFVGVMFVISTVLYFSRIGAI